MSAPPREPGVPWICERGHRHFICAACGRGCISDPRISEEERLAESERDHGHELPPDDRFSVCDDCYPVILERARAAGLIE